MELEAGSLDAQIALGPLSPDLVRSILRQVLAALAPLHELNKCHGAIRPDNLHAVAEGHVELGEPATIPSSKETSAGPAKYLAPELLKPEFGPIGPGVDLYSLGFMALEMLKGPAFDALFPGVGPNDIDVEIGWMRWHSSATETLAPASKLIAGLPEDLGVVLDRMLKKNVRDRYVGAQAALEDLDSEPSVAGNTIHKKGPRSTFDDPGPVLGAQAAWQARAGLASPPQPAWQPAPTRQDVSGKSSGGAGRFGKRIILVLLLALAVAGGLWFFLWAPVSDKIAVTIASEPPHAKVFIDNKPLGTTTNSTFELAPGGHTLRLELDDYEPFEAKIGISDQRRIHKVTLNKIVPKATTRTVRITSIPDSASVYIDGVLTGKTSANVTVPVGPFTLKLSVPGHKTKEMRITSLDQLGETVVLERSRRAVKLTTNPPGADVYIDDRLQDKKTNGSFEVGDGAFILKLAYKGLPDITRKIDDPSTLDQTIVFKRMVRLIVDPPGATLFLDDAQLKGKSSPADVPLPPGKHKVKAVLAGYAAEEKTIDVVDLFQEERLTLRALPVHRHALLVGARQARKDLPWFVHAESDVETLGRALQVGGFKADEMSILTQTRGLANADELPTAAQIKTRLGNLIANTTSADVIVVALVGHAVDFPGVTYFVADGANDANPGTLLSLSEVVATLQKAPALKKLLILDCWRKDWTNRDATAHVRTWDEKPPPGVTILFGCGVGQTGYENLGSWHGAFNLAVIQGLMGEETGPQVTVPALAEFCKRQVGKLANAAHGGILQVPVAVAGDDGAAWAITTPGEVTTDYVLGCALLEQKQFDKAIEAFARAEPNLLSFPELYLRRADAHYNKQQFEAALADFGTALNLDSTSAAAYAYLGEVQRAVAKKAKKTAPADYAEALKNLNKAIELEPACALAYDARGTIYYAYNALEAAAKNYSDATRLQPRFWLAWGNYGLARAKLQKWDDAIAGFSQAIDLIKQDTNLVSERANLFAERGIAWSMKGNPSQAVDDFANIIKLPTKAKVWNLRSPYKEPWYHLASAYSLQKMYAPAKEALLRAVTIDAKYAEAHRLLANVYRELNDDKNAQTHKKIADKLQMK